MWIELYGYASALCAVLIGVMLGVNRSDSLSLRIGSFLFVAISIWLGQLHLFISGTLLSFPDLIFLHVPFAIFSGPLFFLFIQSIFEQEFEWKKFQWAHIVFVIFLDFLFLPVALIPKEIKIEIFQKNLSVVSPHLKYYILFFLNMSYLVPGIYIAFSFRLLFNRRILFSAGKEKALFVFYMILGIFAVSMLFTFSGFRMELAFLKTIGAVGFSTGVFLIFILLSRYPDFLDLVSRDIREIQRKQNRINPELSGSALEKLKFLFEEKKIYLEDDISLQSLGRQLSLRPDQLSQVVNDSYGMNFNRFLNYHRIQEAIRILKKDPDAKIIHVAMRCGFNSKSSFNESFRRETGTTPTEYFKKKSMES